MNNSGRVVQSDGLKKSRAQKFNRRTPAAKWNARTIDALQKELRKDPEINLAGLLTPKYSQNLESLKSIQTPAAQSNITTRNYDLRLILDPNAATDIIGHLSPTLRERLSNAQSLSHAITEMLSEGTVLFEAPSVTVLQVGTIAVKITVDDRTITEWGSLLYLEEHLPNFPSPRPHGLVKTGDLYVLFMSLIPGVPLEEVWHQLVVAGKCDVRAQLDQLLSQLRSLPFRQGTPFGGVQGEGCRDIRRTVYTNTEPIVSAEQFEEFLFAGLKPKAMSPRYAQFLRKLMPEGASCVFTHGDLRPANILVQMAEDGTTCAVQGVIDWEASGFYPPYWESVKATNNLTPTEDSDWYEYLPDSASPHRHGVSWLLDRLLDGSMDNS